MNRTKWICLKLKMVLNIIFNSRKSGNIIFCYYINKLLKCLFRVEIYFHFSNHSSGLFNLNFELIGYQLLLSFWIYFARKLITLFKGYNVFDKINSGIINIILRYIYKLDQYVQMVHPGFLPKISEMNLWIILMITYRFSHKKRWIRTCIFEYRNNHLSWMR